MFSNAIIQTWCVVYIKIMLPIKQFGSTGQFLIAHEGVWTHVRESAQQVGSGSKIPCHTWESNLRKGRHSPTLYQLSFIPIHLHLIKNKKIGRRGLNNETSSPKNPCMRGKAIIINNATYSNFEKTKKMQQTNLNNG